MQQTSLAFAFVAGIISFAAPCVLPIIPGFIAYLGGATLSQTENKRRTVFINSVFFILGFSVVFALLGALLNSILAYAAYSIQLWLSRIGGVIIILFGIYLTNLVSIPFLNREYRFKISPHRSRYLTSFLFGAAFAAGWTPCVGAVLGAILALAATQPGSAFLLLLAYSFGLGIPFLLVGLFTIPAQRFITRYNKALSAVNTLFGFLLIILGILIFTENLSLLANFSLLNSILLR